MKWGAKTSVRERKVGESDERFLANGDDAQEENDQWEHWTGKIGSNLLVMCTHSCESRTPNVV